MKNVNPMDRCSLYPEAPTPLIPDHEVIRCIGRGSYGDVWLARNVIGAYRAVKIIYRSQLESERPFEREFHGIQRYEPISRSHPGLVQVLQVGRNDTAGSFYYVMELGDNAHPGFDEMAYAPRTLSRDAGKGRTPFNEVLDIGIALADALGHLHSHGLVHRDVKPSNIIFVEGRAKLADIGLISPIADDSSLLGTIGYIPPEGRVSAQSDIFSLGKVLYEIATGNDRQAFPQIPEDIESFAGGEQFAELNAVILKACASDPLERYKTAAELSADLELLRAGKSVRRLRILERRISLLTQIAAVSAVLLVAASVVLYFVNDAREREKKLRAAAYIASAARHVDEGNYHAAVPLFGEAAELEQHDSAAAFNDQMRVGMLLRQAPQLLAVWTNAQPVMHVEFFPDGKRLIISQGKLLQFVNLESGQPTSTNIDVGGSVACLSLSPEGQRLVVGSGRRVSIFSVRTGELLHRWPHASAVTAVAFHPDGSRVAVGSRVDGEDARMAIIDVNSGDDAPPLLSWRGHTGDVETIQFSSSGKWVLTAARDDTARMWNATNGAEAGMPLRHSSWVYSAAFSPDERYIATACHDRAVRLWEAPTQTLVTRWPAHKDGVTRVAWSPDGRVILSAGVDEAACLWTRDAQLAHAVLNHDKPITSAAFDAHGRRVATADHGGTIKIWDVAQPLPEELGDTLFNEDGTRCVTASNRTITIFETPAFKPLATARLNRDFRLCEITADGNRVAISATESDATSIAVLEGKNLAPSRWVKVGETNNVDVQVSDDGLYAFAVEAITDREWTCAFWDLRTGEKVVGPLRVKNDPPRAAFGAGNVAAAGIGRFVHVWDLKTGDELVERLKHTYALSALRFTKDGCRLLAAWSDDAWHACGAHVWDWKARRVVAGPFPHDDGVLATIFDRDERLLITASEDKRAVIWRVATGEMIGQTLWHRAQVTSAAFDPESRWTVTGSSDGVVKTWETASGFPIAAPFHHGEPIRGCGFVAGAKGVWVRLSERAVLWRLSENTKSASDLKILAGALGTAAGMRGRGGWSEADVQRWRVAPGQAAGADALRRCDAELAEWHQAEAVISERARDWFAARFHWQQLAGLSQTNAAFQQSFAKADHRWRAARENNPVTKTP
jgi:WD40 repeat protein